MALKILLADDSMTAQNMGKKILVDAGYDVVAVSNGAAAMKKIASDRPDIIILDVYMPGYTGLEVCERVKAAEETSNTPVLLTVGKMEPFKPEDANRVKADGVMVKPFEASDLIAVVKNIGKEPAGTAKITGLPVPPVPPVPSYKHADTIPIPPPSDAIHEDTVRLTPEQIRQFQDDSYNDWSNASEAMLSRPAEQSAQEMSVTTSEEEISPVIVPSPISYGQLEEEDHEEPEPFVASSVIEALTKEEGPNKPATRGYGVFEEPVPTSVAEEEPAVTAPGEAVHPAADAQAVEVAAVEVAAEAEAQPFIAVQSESVVPEAVEVVPEVAAWTQPVAVELETSAAVSTAPIFITAPADFEPNVAPPEETVVAIVAPDLEVTSPVELRAQEVMVDRDPALLTEADDLAGFVTKFGKPGAEEVSVGMASDLSPEQFAAISQPEAVVTKEVAEEVAAMLGINSESFLQAAPDTTAYAFTSSAMDQMGVVNSEPVVAYVPGYSETQQFAHPVQDEVEPVISAVSESVAETVAEPVVETTVESEPVAKLEAAQPEPVAHATWAMQTAAAAVAGVGSGTWDSQTFRQEEAAPALVSSVEVEAPVSAASESTTSDTGLADQLVAALAGEQHAIVQEVVAVSSEASDAEAPEADDPGSTSMRLSEAVAKAFERLKPQLITEIMKELKK